LPDAQAQLDAIQVRHENVQNYQIGAHFLYHFPQFFSTVSGIFYLITPAREITLENI
jgi:hypothetical protein